VLLSEMRFRFSQVALAGFVALALSALIVSAASAASTVPTFSVKVSAKSYVKHGSKGRFLKSVSVSGPGVKVARPEIKCSPKYCGRLVSGKGKLKRTRLYRSPVKFTNINWLVAAGHGFDVAMMPRSRKLTAVIVKLLPPDSLNKKFTIGYAGCITRKWKSTPCPLGATLPAITHRVPGPSTPPYQQGGELAAVSIDSTHLMLLTTSADGHLWSRVYSGDGTWGEWVYVGGQLQSGPAAVHSDTGRVDVVAKESTDGIAHFVYEVNSGWSKKTSIAAQIIGEPTISSWKPGRLDLFARNPSNGMLRVSSENGGSTWSPLESHGEFCLASSPSAVSMRAERIDIVLRGCSASELSHLAWEPAMGWIGDSLGGVLGLGRPGIATDGVHSNLSVPTTNTGNKVAYTFFLAGWQPFTDLHSPTVSSSPVPIWLDPTHFFVFARDPTGNVIVESWQTVVGWSAWTTLWK
jgi:hypothetical protein